MDSNATTRMADEVFEAMVPWMRERYANPNGAYRGAKEARAAMERAREQVAALMGAEADEVVFTSGGTEANNTALKWLARLVGRKTGRVITSQIEHSSVLQVCRNFAQVGYGLDEISVSGQGVVCLEEFEEKIRGAREGGGFVSLQAANNEVGTLQPVVEVAQWAREYGLAFHCDAVQAAGKVEMDWAGMNADFVSISGHKIHGPKGIGALRVRRGCRFEPLLRGGGQERGMRSGTENVAGIVGFGVAAELAKRNLLENGERMRVLRDELERELIARISGVTLHATEAERLPQTVHVGFEGCEAAGLLILLDEMGVAASAGSACMTGKQQPSHVQTAMGFSARHANSSLRLSFSREMTREKLIEAVEKIERSVEKLRSVQGFGTGPVVVYTP